MTANSLKSLQEVAASTKKRKLVEVWKCHWDNRVDSEPENVEKTSLVVKYRFDTAENELSGGEIQIILALSDLVMNK